MALSSETRLSINSLEAISARKCWPPFLTQVSVSFMASQHRIASQGSAASALITLHWAGEQGMAGATYVQGAQLGVWVLVADALL